MLITPRPGAERKNIRQVLSGVHTTAMNLQRPYLTAFEGLWTYLEWATESARMLRSQISDRDLDVLNVRILEIAGLIARLQGPRELTEWRSVAGQSLGGKHVGVRNRVSRGASWRQGAEGRDAMA